MGAGGRRHAGGAGLYLRDNIHLTPSLVGGGAGQQQSGVSQLSTFERPERGVGAAGAAGVAGVGGMYTLQKLHLSAALTVEQNLAMAQWAAGQHENRERIAATLHTLNIAELGRRKPAQLSGGQAQRVAALRG